MKRIRLTRGEFAFVDDCDYYWLSKVKWCVARTKNTQYAMRRARDKTIYMHRVIMESRSPYLIGEVDHVDGNGLNNTRANLRVASHQENCFNHGKRPGARSEYYGVSWHKHDKRWVAQICLFAGGRRRNINLGSFKTEEAAAKAYDSAAMELFGQFARLNFSYQKGDKE